ncbi:hypothetical protein PNC88_12750 [Enterococcus faecium]|nr:hypothetical protein [Enterococcus faecium]
MLGGADNPNGELLSYIIGADTVTIGPQYLYERIPFARHPLF